MSPPFTHRACFEWIVIALTVILLVFAPARATSVAAQDVVVVSHGHLATAFALTAHAGHHGAAHDHAQDVLAEACWPSCARGRRVEDEATASVILPYGLILNPDHKPKA